MLYNVHEGSISSTLSVLGCFPGFFSNYFLEQKQYCPQKVQFYDKSQYTSLIDGESVINEWHTRDKVQFDLTFKLKPNLKQRPSLSDAFLFF